MGTYTKKWLSLDEQVDQLAARGVGIDPREQTLSLLQAVGYYRLTGYLYPFRNSDLGLPQSETNRSSARILAGYRPGTTIEHVAQIIDFDRELRMLVLDGVERLEVAGRMRIGFVLGRRSAFAHLDPGTFHPGFVCAQLDQREPSKHSEWLRRVAARRDKSDEAFVAHFRDEYDGQMPIWALTEILELGSLSRLYQGLNDEDAQEIASAFGVPTKRLMQNWLASVNYVRNVAAHHSRLFNRKLVHAPKRPNAGAVPLLEHMRDSDSPKGRFGTYNALAVIAYLLRAVDGGCEWSPRVASLLRVFPSSPHLTVDSLGAPGDWEDLAIWCPRAGD